METQSKYYLSTDRYKELLDDYIRDKKELAELLGVHPYHTLMMRAVQDLLKEVDIAEPVEVEERGGRIRCFCEKEPKDQTYAWEFYEDGSTMFFSDKYPEGNPSTWCSSLFIERAEELVKCNHWIEYEAWELDEPLPSDYPKYTLRHNE